MLYLVCLVFLLLGEVHGDYEPTWESLDTRPLPSWYDEAKIGIFIHWGVFSVPSYGSEWFWKDWKGDQEDKYVKFMTDNFRPNFTYPEFAKSFTAEFYDPVVWAELFNASRARYVVLTSKHHEGFTNWPSIYSWNWNSVDIGPKRDLVGDLATAIRAHTPHIHFGLYHSLYEWFNPVYLRDKQNQYTTNDFVITKTLPELYELVNAYEPDVIWSDGDWMAADTYWNSTVFLAWLFNSSPVKDQVVVNDRWGILISCHHGSYFTCSDRYNPGVLQKHKWENAMTLDKLSWGFRRDAQLADYLTIHELLTTLAETISCGGNLLVNVGPTHDGRIPTIMEERLRQLGSWLDINGEAVFETKPWTYQNDTIAEGVWYTSNEGHVYAIVLTWPENHNLTLGSVTVNSNSKINMFGYEGDLQYWSDGKGVVVGFPELTLVTSQWVWVLDLVDVDPA